MSQNKLYNNISYWLDSSEEALTPRPTLSKSTTVDIAILGGGYTALWTAYYLIEKDPSLNIAILEKEIVGFGASGRNGGWCSPKFSVTPEMLIQKYGEISTKEMMQAMFDSVNEIEQMIEKEALQVDWKKSGMLQIARGNYNLPVLENSFNLYKSLGFEQYVTLLDQKETRNRVRIEGTSGGLLTTNAAVIHPGKLVRQLANVLEEKGVRIYEQTEVIDFEKGDSQKEAQFIISNGMVVRAKRAALLSGEAYLTQLKKMRRSLLPVYSLITLTEPLSEKQWEEIGWKSREAVSSTDLSVNYLQKTIDGRILFGGRGAPYHFGSKIKDSFDLHKPTHRMLKESVKEWFPTIAKDQFSHSWGGPVGMPRDWTPNFTYDEKTKIGGAWGYVGQGVSTTNLAGRILTDLILNNNSLESQLPIAQHHSKKWEVEPFRWIGARYVQSGMEKVDEKSKRKRKAPSGKTLPERLSRH